MSEWCLCEQTGLTPLMEAASGGYVEVGRVLLDKGADIAAAPVPVSRDTALTIAADKGHHRFVELLLTRSVCVTASHYTVSQTNDTDVAHYNFDFNYFWRRCC